LVSFIFFVSDNLTTKCPFVNLSAIFLTPTQRLLGSQVNCENGKLDSYSHGKQNSHFESLSRWERSLLQHQGRESIGTCLIFISISFPAFSVSRNLCGTEMRTEISQQMIYTMKNRLNEADVSISVAVDTQVIN
jgi:hypothetical protein